MSCIEQHIKKLAETNDKKTIRQLLYKQGIISSYSQHDGRIICSTSKNDRFKDSSATNMWGECNGFIYDIEQKKTLVIPTHTCRTHVNTNIVNAKISRGVYDIYKIIDGTICNFYFYEPSDAWEISTTRGYKMSNQTWNGKSYKEMIEESLKPYNINFTELCNKLDKHLCYTFGFKHPNMHPFREGQSSDIYKFWFVQSVDTTHRKYHNLPSDIKIDKQEKIVGVNNIRTLYVILKRSLDMFLSSGQVNYGFILRKNDGDMCNDIILESSLMQKIRHMVYNKNVRSYFDTDNVDKLLATVNYFNVNTKDLYVQLFPQDIDTYKQLNSYFSLSIKEITDTLNKKEENCKKEKLSEIPQWFIKHVSTYITNTHSNPLDLENYVSSIIYNPRYIKLFHGLVNPDAISPIREVS